MKRTRVFYKFQWIVLVILFSSLSTYCQNDAEGLYQKGLQAYKKNDYSTAMTLFRKAAESGHTEAQYQLGYMYSLNMGNIPHNYQESIKWLKKAVEKNNTAAMCQLAFMYSYGHGVEKSETLQMEWYRKAAGLGDPNAMYSMASRYQEGKWVNGKKVNRNYKEAERWYLKAALFKDIPKYSGTAYNAMWNLAKIYEEGLGGVQKDLQKAANIYGYLLDHGWNASQDKLSKLRVLGVLPCKYFANDFNSTYEREQTNRQAQFATCKQEQTNGLSAKKMFDRGVTADKTGNYSESVKWYRKDAEQGVAEAQFNLGVCYYEGNGVSRNYLEAVKWYRKAGEQDYAKAQFNLGLCYELGNGVSQNYLEAVKWYRKAAEQGVAEAQFNLGVCYYKGNVVSQNYTQAVNWYRKAAEQGYARAQACLGICYYKGNGVSLNYSESVKWFRKAAEQGYAEAQFNLGLCYELGNGVSQNYLESVKWYRKAAEQGNAVAKKKLDFGL